MGAGRAGSFRRAAGGAAVVAVMVLSAACGSSDGSGTSDGSSLTATPATTPPPVLTASELADALLTISDLPPGWSEATSDPDSSGSSDFLCPTGATSEKTEGHPSAGSMFQQSDMGPMLLQELSSAADADEHFGDVKAVFDSCVGETWTEDFGGTAVPVTLVEISGATAGERSMSYRISGTDEASAVTVTIDFTVVGRSTVIEMYAAVNASSPLVTVGQLSAAEFASIVAEGDTKVAAALEAAATDDGSTS